MLNLIIPKAKSDAVGLFTDTVSGGRIKHLHHAWKIFASNDAPASTCVHDSIALCVEGFCSSFTGATGKDQL